MYTFVYTDVMDTTENNMTETQARQALTPALRTRTGVTLPLRAGRQGWLLLDESGYCGPFTWGELAEMGTVVR